MYQISYKLDGVNWCYHAPTKVACDHYINILKGIDVNYDIVESEKEMMYQVCGCLFKADGQIYMFIRYENDAKAGMSAYAEVVDSYGNKSMKEVIIVDIEMKTISDIQEIAAKIGRKQLNKIVKVWQRKIN